MERIYKFAKIIYSKTYILTILWSFTMFLLFMKTNYHKCLEKEVLIATTNNLFLIVAVLFMIVAIVNIIFVMFASSNNKKLLKDEEHTKEGMVFRDTTKITILIIPLFYIWIFALSKIIVVLMKKTNDINFNNYLLIWVGLFLFSFIYWLKLKDEADENQRYNISYTIIIGFSTYIIIYWENLVPYIKKIFSLGSCIITDIMK